MTPGTIGQQLPMAESALVREELRKVDRSTGLSTFNRIFDGFSKSTFHVSNVPNIPTLRGPSKPLPVAAALTEWALLSSHF
jgi:hypothetical protein